MICVWALALLALLVLPVAGCTAWPPHGTGGLAERYPTNSPEIQSLEDEYHRLLELGTQGTTPAAMEHARSLLIRARREYAGALYQDAGQTIARLRRALRVLTGVPQTLAPRLPSASKTARQT